MSWATHEFEPYTLQRHLGGRVSFLALALGSFGPDTFTKWYVYGIDRGAVHLGAANPAQFHRGWPGAGFTHSLAFVAAAGLLVWLVTRSRAWGLGNGIGAAAHVVTDISDNVGTLLFVP
ncbi:MAG: metal-dependent hydrolase, partial [Gemmatimonadales bacterium]